MLGALAGIALLGPSAALAQAPGSGTPSNASSSGGPGTLGTEVPNDSSVAQAYYDSRSSVDSDADRQLAESLRQLLVDNRSAMEQAKQVAASGDPVAQEVVAAREIVEFNLLKGAQESGFDLGEDADSGGTAASAEEPSTDASSESTGSSEPSTESGSTAEIDVQEHASSADDLVQQARDANRHQLASLLERAQKALDSAANASVGSATP